MASGKEEYGDIFDLPHHVSSKRAPMPKLNRAAQFSPFAALVGYGESVEEAARVTGQRIVLCDDELARLNEQLSYLQRHIKEQPAVTILYFEADERKDGGTYREYCGKVKRIREYEEVVEMESGLVVPFSDIASIK